MAVRIRLSLLGDSGAIASIHNTENGDDIDLVTRRGSRNAKAICKDAAEKLRALASHFDRLAEMSEPFREATQKLASRPPKSSKT